VADVLVAFYHAAGFSKHESGKLQRFFAAKAQFQKLELRCRLVAFFAGASPADTVEVIAQKRLEGVRDKTEETIAKNPRMPAQRQSALRQEAETVYRSMIDEVSSFREDAEVKTFASRLPSWMLRSDVLQASLSSDTSSTEDHMQARSRGEKGQSALERWGAAWVKSQAHDRKDAPQIQALYNAFLMKSKVPIPHGIKSEVDGLFCVPGGDGNSSRELVALAEAKHSVTTLYDDVPKMDSLLEYLSATCGTSDVAFSQSRQKGKAGGGQEPQTVSLKGLAPCTVHYVLGCGDASLTLRTVIEKAALPAENGRMLKEVCEVALGSRADQDEAVFNFTEVFEFAADGDTLRLRLKLPKFARDASQKRVQSFAENLVHKVDQGKWTFWVECTENSTAAEEETETSSTCSTVPAVTCSDFSSEKVTEACSDFSTD